MLADYRTAVFDCDGVVLDSNKVKTAAFRSAALPYGAAAADALVAYHTANGGVSRYAKFSHFLEAIVPGQAGPGLDALLAAYAAAVQDGLRVCAVAPGLAALRAVGASVAAATITERGEDVALGRERLAGVAPPETD